MNILLFGAPGAGKGTQSSLLSARKSLRHVSTGDLFREAIKKGTPLGLRAKQYLDAGALVPDEVTIGLIKNVFLGFSDFEFILDGFPRTVAQADALNEFLMQHSLVLGRVIFLSVPEAVLIRRLSGRRVCVGCGTVYHVESKIPRAEGICDSCGGSLVQRPDDFSEVIAQRLKAYEVSTAPLKDYYRKADLLVEVDGLGNPEEIYQRIVGVMNEAREC